MNPANAANWWGLRLTFKQYFFTSLWNGNDWSRFRLKLNRSEGRKDLGNCEQNAVQE